MMFSSRHAKTLAVIILVSILFYPIYIAQAASWLLVIKEYVLDLIGRIIGRILLSLLNNSIVGKILGAGRFGGPAFIQDWRNFLQGGQYRGEGIFRAMVGNITLGSGATACPYFRQSLTTAFNVKGLVPNFDPDKYRLDSLQPFKLSNKCTLPNNFNAANFRNDFTRGGWSTWDKLIQPQNNFYGVYGNSLAELEKQRGFEQGVDLHEGTAGSGFTGKRADCEGAGPNTTFQCVILGKVITPGQLFSDSTAATINSELDWLISSDELEEVLISVVSTITARLSAYAVNSALPGVSGPQYQIGDDDGSNAPDLAGQAQQECVDSCVANNCPASAITCEDADGDGLPEPETPPGCLMPGEPDPRDACVSDCQAQC